jgi:uncharacterized membrane protein HdeD (DUF308 family)
MIRLIHEAKTLIYKIGLIIYSLSIFLLYLPTGIINNVESKSFRIAQMIWGVLCITAMFVFFLFNNLITFIIGIILGLSGIHQIWLGISGKSKKIAADYKSTNRDHLEIGG